MEKIRLTISAASGVEGVVKRELKRLGFGEPPAEFGAMSFDAEIADVARLNVFLRAADRVYLSLARFPAATFDEFFDGVKNIPWEEILPQDAKIVVDGKSFLSRLYALSACQSVAKKAIAERMKSARGISVLPESGATVKVFFRILRDVAEISLDTTGTGLHKRGYRDRVGSAPIRENLAAAMVLLSDYYYGRPFADPFCGSGTIAIETAMLALDIAPGLLRRFDFENFPFYPRAYLERAREEAKDKEKRERKISVTASDIDPQAVKMAKRHAARAGVADCIRFEVKDAARFENAERAGVIVTNPPYGDRLLDERRAHALIGELGRRFAALKDWSLFAISADKNFEKAFGRKADKRRKLYNSEKECGFYEYFTKREKENGR